MKINRVSTIGTPSNRQGERGRAGKSGAFSRALGDDGQAPSASSVSGGAAVAQVDALLALQEVMEVPGSGSQGRRRGEALLDRLDELRLGLLFGRLSKATVERLVAVLESKRGEVDDPQLAQVLDEIELRAAVELAKLGQ